MGKWIAEHPLECEALWYAFLAGLAAVMTLWIALPLVDRLKQRAINAELAEQRARREREPFH